MHLKSKPIYKFINHPSILNFQYYLLNFNYSYLIFKDDIFRDPDSRFTILFANLFSRTIFVSIYFLRHNRDSKVRT